MGRESDGEAFACVCVYVCLCECARACACAHVYVTYTHSFSHVRVCVCACDDSLYCKAAPCSVCCVHLAVLGAVGGCLASSAHEWLLHRLGAAVAQRGIAAVALGRCVLRPWHLESLGTLVTSQASSRRGQRSCRRGSDRKTSGAALSRADDISSPNLFCIYL